jgi:hypothetical protein
MKTRARCAALIVPIAASGGILAAQGIPRRTCR